MTWEKFMLGDSSPDICRMAILLAMTQTQDDEKELIAQYQVMGFKSAATTVSGFVMGSQPHIVRNVVNLCLNTGILERKRTHIHPLCHCILETCQSTRAFDAVGQNFCFKAAVVRRGAEFSLCFYGNLGMHELTSHKSIGVGYQILGA